MIKAVFSLPLRATEGFLNKGGQPSEWKRESGYHKRSLSETAMYRYKTLIGNQLSLRCHNAQVAEVLVGVRALNRVVGLDMPERQEVQY